MRAITVNTTSYELSNMDAHIENKDAHLVEYYATNNSFGIFTSEDKPVYHSDSEAVKCNVYISALFPGTQEEWSYHIFSCIEQKLQDAGFAFTTKEGFIFLKEK